MKEPCKNPCEGCPWAFTEKSEMIQNYGCLPEPMDTIVMRVSYGKTWSCHENTKKPCVGTLNELRSLDLDARVLDRELINEGSDFLSGFAHDRDEGLHTNVRESLLKLSQQKVIEKYEKQS